MYKLIIPTYKRAETLKNKTMAYLKKTNINAKNIFIYVANKEEKELYENTIDKNSYAEIIIGKRGLPQQRNFIQKTHKIGENLFMLDDDLKSIKMKVNDKVLTEINDLDSFINFAFDICNKNKTRYFGTYPVDNPYFMKNVITFDLRYIVANISGTVNNHDIFRDEGEECEARKNFTAGKESHEMTIKYFLADKSIARFNYIAPTSTYWGGEGGHQVSRNIKGEKAATEWLYKKYPQYFKKVLRKNGMWDLVIKRKKK